MNFKELNKNNVIRYFTGIITGFSLSYLFLKLRKFIANKKKSVISTKAHDEQEMDIEIQKKLLIDNNELALVREQLKRNYEFFGEEGMKDIINSFVVVVGIGGVGSHVVMTLIRSGITKIRVVDYDIVTLSSLNRHAFACRADVGKLKVRVVKEYAEKINPNIIIETVDDAFIYEYASQYILKDKPDYVVDCIDDLEAKCDLLKFCDDNILRVITSMGAGAKMDPTCIKITEFHYVQGDKLAKRMRYLYKKKFGGAIADFKTVYSTEKAARSLSELEEHQKENPEIYRINENERVRSLPVFASIPAIFGQALASAVLCDLSKMPIVSQKYVEENTKIPTTTSASLKECEDFKPRDDMIGNVSIRKLYDDFRQFEANSKRKEYSNKIKILFTHF